MGLVDENIGLVFLGAGRAANKYGGTMEEWIGPCYEIAAEAERTFDPEKGKLSTHLIRAMAWKTRNLALLTRRQQTTIGPRASLAFCQASRFDRRVLNIEEAASDESRARYRELADTRPNHVEEADERDSLEARRDLAQRILASFEHRTADVLIRHARGETYRQIATSHGVTSAAIGARAKKARLIAAEEFEDEYRKLMEGER